MTEIEKERRVLDGKRLYDQGRQLDKVKEDLNEVKGQVEGEAWHVLKFGRLLTNIIALHVQKEREHLSLLKEKLLPPNFDADAELKEYSLLVQEAFLNMRKSTPFEMSRFRRHKLFCAWMESKTSSLILIRGVSNRSDACWLSPVVFNLLADLRAADRSVVFHCCQNKVDMETDIALSKVLSHLVYQVLSQNPSLIRDQDEFKNIYTKVNNPARNFKELQAILKALLRKLPEPYILLDRVDRIKGQAYDWMKTFADIVKESKNRIKILMVASWNAGIIPGGKFGGSFFEGLEDDLGSKFLDLSLDQR